MKTLDTGGISPRTVKQLLGFLNEAIRATDISRSDSLLKDNPDVGTGRYRIGKTVAGRIIEKRKSLEAGLFQSLDELNGIDGLGQDKFQDLVYSFHFSAADEFVRQMYADVMDAHWKLEHLSEVTTSPEVFRNMVADPVSFRNHVARMIGEQIHVQAENEAFAREFAANVLCGTEAHLKVSEKEADFSWALWFYRMGTKRWFGFEQVREKISQYFHTYSDTAVQIEWRVFRNFQSESILRSSTYDLPVTVNYTEQTISLWRAEILE